MTRPKSPVRLDWMDSAVCSLDYRLKLIGRLPFFRHLPADEITRINGRFHDHDVRAGQTIYFEGDEAESLYLVALGKVKLVRNAATGREVLLDILRRGDYFGNLAIFGMQLYPETAVAQTDCCLLTIATDNFAHILSDHPDVMRKVLEAVSQRLQESQEIIEQLSVFTVEQRIAAALLRLATKLGEAVGAEVLIQLPFSRQDLASMTATTTETVSRVMSHFADAGLVKSGRKWVTIQNKNELEKVVKRGTVN
jgi:CRP-like cAMP-binding protein